MEIRFEKVSSDVPIKNLKAGDTFLHGGNVYIVTDNDKTYLLINTARYVCCVALRNGRLYDFDKDSLVTQIRCVLTVEGV